MPLYFSITAGKEKFNTSAFFFSFSFKFLLWFCTYLFCGVITCNFLSNSWSWWVVVGEHTVKYFPETISTILKMLWQVQPLSQNGPPPPMKLKSFIINHYGKLWTYGCRWWKLHFPIRLNIEFLILYSLHQKCEMAYHRLHVLCKCSLSSVDRIGKHDNLWKFK